MNRVLVIGCGGAGKTTLSRRLGQVTGLPVVHLDLHYWRPNWEAVPNDEWQAMVQRLMREPEWIMDGTYGGTMETRIAAADTVIFLDMPRSTCLWRVIKRRFQHRGRHRPSLPAGCREQLSWEFLVWIWRYSKTRRPGVLDRLQRASHDKEIVTLRRRAEVDRYLAAVQARRT